MQEYYSLFLHSIFKGNRYEAGIGPLDIPHTSTNYPAVRYGAAG